MSFSLEFPRRPEDAASALSDHSAGEVVVMAGGTDLLLDMDEGLVAPKRVIALRDLPWGTFSWKEGALEIGSTAPLIELERDPRIRQRMPGFWQAVRAVGGVPLRHRATVGGNLARASPASDLIPILLALDARVELFGLDSPRSLPVAEFIKGSRQTDLRSGELIRSVTIPEALASTYLWQRVRPANDISQVGVAVALADHPPHWRVAVGGVSPCPQRMPSAESALSSPEPVEVELELAAQEAAQKATFVTDKRATEAYRRRLLATLIRRAVRQTVLNRAAQRREGRAS